MSEALIYIVGTHSTETKGGISSVLKAFEESFYNLNEKFERINTHNDQKSRVIYFFIAWIKLVTHSFRNLKSRRVYWLHCGPWLSMLRKFIIAITAKLLGGEVVIHFHSPTLSKYMQNKWGVFLIKCFLSPVDKVVVVTPWWKELLAQKGIKKEILVVANPLSHKLFNFTERNIADKKPIGHIVKLVSMARLIDGKGIELVIKTMAELPNMTLKIIGDGPLKSELKQLSQSLNVQSRVSFLGWLEEEEKSKALSNSDIFCLPSIYDSFGVVFIEAMSLNLPIVAFNNGPVADIVKPHVGITIEKYNVEHLKKGIEEVVNNSNDYRLNGKPEVLNNYNPTSLTKKIITYLKQ
ncbi:MAG: hypothetical protein CL624_12670 [Arcobacter sp.]|nr:hypothetical protein [Arcobacter sp.]|tara:strand:+ start:846 stop:1898 length:1053 start_codon:yes stop_codon:yes gene_type:complete